MVTPTQKIRAGLDAHERDRAGQTTPKLAVLAGITGDPNSIQTICASVKKARERLVAIRAVEAKAASLASEAAHLEWRDRGVSIDESNIRTDSMGGTNRRRFIEADIRNARKARLEKTAEERAKLAATLREAKASLDLVRDLWASPVAVLMRSTLGSEKRATYAANLAAAGPTEVDAAMSLAARTGDKDLAAAACVRIDGLTKEARKSLKFSKSEVAEHMVAKDFNAATEALGLADYYRESGDLAAREIEGSRISPNAKIRVGQKLMELEIQLGRKIAVDGDGDGTGQRKGEDFDAYLDRKYPGGALPPGMTIIEDDGSERHE